MNDHCAPGTESKLRPMHSLENTTATQNLSKTLSIIRIKQNKTKKKDKKQIGIYLLITEIYPIGIFNLQQMIVLLMSMVRVC